MDSAEFADWQLYRTTRSLAARNRLAERHLRCCELAARHFSRRMQGRIAPDELLGNACEGLLHAIELFDPERGTRFSTFAQCRIHGAILDALRHHDFLPRRERHRAIRRTAQATLLAQRLGRKPSTEELEAAGTLPAQRGEVLSLNSFASADAAMPGPLIENLAAADCDPAHALQRIEFWQTACQGLAGPERQALLMYHREGAKLSDVAATLGWSDSYTSQVLTRIRQHLRKLFDRPTDLSSLRRSPR